MSALGSEDFLDMGNERRNVTSLFWLRKTSATRSGSARTNTGECPSFPIKNFGLGPSYPSDLRVGTKNIAEFKRNSWILDWPWLPPKIRSSIEFENFESIYNFLFMLHQNLKNK
ncbi:hypothetical protein BpHYR1_051665 [Brachionus plicatilis]|uniref:Uncharacterized protein n=1 Tax=Brachionus plicatilis TaxID=10195 RepID=A0A3M7PW61_BRAPC|nr:hypothetical protein BpHYR1_051665 [Brachionus plicatilis]